MFESNENSVYSVLVRQTPPMANPPIQKQHPGWKKGQSGNPKGRRPGSINRKTGALKRLLDRDGKKVLMAAIQAALGGDVQAMRLVLDRWLPRERLVAADMPKVTSVASAQLAAARALDLATLGELTRAEAEHMSRLARNYLELCSIEKLEARVAELEAERSA